MFLFRESRLAPGFTIHTPFFHPIPADSQLPLPPHRARRDLRLGPDFVWSIRPVYTRAPASPPPHPAMLVGPLVTDVPLPLHLLIFRGWPRGVVRRILEFELPVGALSRSHLPPHRFQ